MSAISQVVMEALADSGYTAKIPPVRLPTRSTTGLVICSPPRNTSRRPYSTACMSSRSCLARHGWLKKTQLRRAPSRSLTSTSTRARRFRPGMALTFSTVARTVASSPTSSSPTVASRLRSR